VKNMTGLVLVIFNREHLLHLCDFQRKISEKNLQKVAQTITHLLKHRCTNGAMQCMFKDYDNTNLHFFLFLIENHK